MNIRLKHIWLSAFLLVGFSAMAQTHVKVEGNVFGGGNKAPVGGKTSVLIDQANDTIGGDVYGGGAFANVGTNPEDSTQVTILQGVVIGNVYGGGLGDSTAASYNGTQNIAALVYGKVFVTIGNNSGGPTLKGSVFGCNNINGTPLDSVFVNIFKTAHTTGEHNNQYPNITTLAGLEATIPANPDDPNYTKQFAIAAVYGGGNKASYKPALNSNGKPKCTTVHVYGCEENTIHTIYGGGNAANVGDTLRNGDDLDTVPANTRLILDGGRYDRVFGGGNGFSAATPPNHDHSDEADYNPGANIFGTAYTNVYGGLYRQVFGGSNQYGDIDTVVLTIDKTCTNLLIHESFGGANEAEIHSDVTTTLLCNDYHIGSFYGGSNLADITGNVTLNVRGGNYSNVFGGSKGYKDPADETNNVSADINGNVTLNLLGGTMENAFGGNDVFGNITGAITVNVWDTVAGCSLQVDTVYGGGRDAAYTPNLVAGKKIVSPVVNLWNGLIGHSSTKGCVFGGGKGNDAKVTANPKVMIGDTITEHTTAKTINLNGGSIFGGGNAAPVDGIDSVLMLKDNSVVSNLFGGGNKANADSTVVMMTVSAEVDTIFGGGNLAGLEGAAMVIVTKGTVRGGIYGGSNKDGLVKGNITVNVTDNTDDTQHHTTIGATGAPANIHGGGYGADTRTKGHVTVNYGEIAYDGSSQEIHSSYPLVYGDIYGGSALGWVNDVSDGVDTTTINILNGEIKQTTVSSVVKGGNIYGGGLGDKTNNIAAKVNGKVYVNIGDTVVSGSSITYRGKAVIDGSVFGCNNLNGSPQDSVFVNIYSTHHTTTPINNTYPSGITTLDDLASNSSVQRYAIQAVYGGGNEAGYIPPLDNNDKPRSATVHVFGCENNTIKEVYGGGNAASVGSTGTNATSANTFVIIDGGRINRVFGGGKGVADGGGVAANIYGTATTTISAGLIDTIFGGSNMKGNIDSISLILAHDPTACGEIFNQVYGGANVAVLTGDLSTTIECGVDKIGDIYGGSNLANINGNVELNIRGGQFTNVFGGSKGALGTGNGANISGDVVLNLEGGTMVNAFGGSNVQGNIGGYITVNVLDTVTGCGLQVDTIYGGGQKANYTPALVAGKKIVSPVVNLLKGTVGHGTVKGCVFGGGKEASVTAHPKVVIGDTRTGNESYVAQVLGNVFGGGNLAVVDGIDSVLMLKGNSQVVNLFGGGNMANADSTVVMMTAGVVDTIFGGGNMAGLAGAAKVALSGGTVNKGVYGGCNASGTVTGDIAVNVDGGNVGASGNEANVHGGGFGQPTKSKGNVEVTIGNGVGGPTIYGDVYGGSALGTVNNDQEAVNSGKHTYVTLNKGTINGNLYGGGLGEKTNTTDIPAKVWSPVTVNIYGGTVANVFGCNNENGAPQSTVLVNVSDTTKAHSMNVTNVFGGGNLAQYSGAPQVNILNGTVSGNVFGGGKGELASGNDRGVKGKVTGNPQVTIGDDVTGHTAHVTGDVYGGGDAANVDGTPVVVVNDCNTTIGYLYGGGNAADVKGTNITVNAGTITHQAFGGGHGDKTVTVEPLKYADVNGHVVFNVYGGTIAQVFAGSNSKGAITGTTALTINKTNDVCAMKIGEVYGGGNEADGNAGTITIGCTGTWTNSHDTHNSTNNRIGYELEGIGTVYGGANRANIGTSSDHSDITLNITSGIIDTVFGGNNQSGTINGTITVNVNKNSNSCSWYLGNVFGGGNQAQYDTLTGYPNYPQVNVLNGAVSYDVFGGGLGSTGNAGKVTGNPRVTVNGSDAAVNGGVYGGGSLAPTEGDPLVTQTLGATAKVFGGGKAANVNGAPTVNINGGTVSSGVYGGCDSQGDVSGNIIVNITNGTIGTDATHRADIYGGGYGAGTSTQGNVTVNFGEATSAATAHTEFPKLYGDVYGGSALGSVNSNNTNTTMVNIMNGTLKTNSSTGTTIHNQTYYNYAGGNVFGGGLGEEGNTEKGKVNGRVVVNIGTFPTSKSRELHPEGDTLIGQAIIEGNVYGCNNTSGSPQDSVTVNIYRTYMREKDTVTYSGADATYALNNVFGGGNKANYVPATGATNKKLKVMIHGCYNTINRVFGGSNAAAAGATGNTVKVVTDINGGRFNEVFGGGNGEVSAANIFGDVNLGIHGGFVNEFYVGSNNLGSISGASNVKVDQTGGCEEISITEFFCGGKYADFVGDINATITCSQGMNVTNLYGGCKEAHVKAGNGGSGNIHLVVNGGTFENVYGGSKGTPTKGADVQGSILLEINGGTVTNAIFGGSNVKGAIGGSITVNVEQKTGADYCPLHVSTAEVYGGGNKANYPGTPASDSPLSGTITHTSPYNYPQVNIKNATVKNVYGGGLEAEVKGNPQIRIKKGSEVLGNVYGGGNMGEVDGNPKVIVNGKDDSANPNTIPTSK